MSDHSSEEERRSYYVNDRNPRYKRGRDRYDYRDYRDRYSRSPPRKRRRDYGDRRGYRYSRSSRRRSSRSRPSSHRKRLEGSLKTFREFLESYDTSRMSYSESVRCYEDYKNEYDKENQRDFFRAHRSEPWFRELYHPDHIKSKRSKQKEETKERFETFLLQYKDNISGLFDLDLSADAHIDELAPIVLEEEKEEIEETEEASNDSEQSSKEVEEEMQIEGDINGQEKEEGEQEENKEQVETKLERHLLEPVVDPKTIYLSEIPVTVSTGTLKEIFGQSGLISRFIITPPNPRNQFIRQAWITYSTEEFAHTALSKEYEFLPIQPILHTEGLDVKYPNVTPYVENNPELRIERDLKYIKRIIRLFDAIYNINNHMVPPDDEDTNEISETESDVSIDWDDIKKQFESLTITNQLDVLIKYLREVHCFCFYCCKFFDDPQVLEAACIAHYRGTEQYHPRDIDPNKWSVEIMDRSLKDVVYSLKLAKEATGQQTIQEYMKEYYSERKGKTVVFHCELCDKKFRGEIYVKKHLKNKHTKETEETKSQAITNQFYTNYIDSPRRIKPSDCYPPITEEGMRNVFADIEREREERETRREEYRRERRSRRYGRNYPPEEPADPRRIKSYVDLDKPPEEDFDLDYAKGLDMFGSND